MVFHGPTMDGGRTVATTQDATDGDHDDVDQKVFTVARVPRVGQGFEIRGDGTDIDEFRHESHPCKNRGPRAGAGPTRLVLDSSPVDSKDSDYRKKRKAAQIAYLCALAGTVENSTTKPSAIVGCVNTASRRAV